ncbi:zona pellucida sperm-binding protein 1 [Choloepus didactylus]|uniref:zona pellucida sperm-binding protein 1 n=1 Tax=Choloepus didactylus TaxID=27675 RepID=UPI0018A02B5A|nr:zona pellucida sperm-binding protein 1 [Choloepus didactylus]
MGTVVCLGAGDPAMAWERCVALPLLLTVAATLGLGLGQWPQPEPGHPGPWNTYVCRIRGLQLLLSPRPGQTLCFKVVDEFGDQFAMNNCSICYHWISSKPHEPVVFSAGYKGCHVLGKVRHSHLRVLIEALLPDGRVDVAQDATLICPKPDHTWTLGTHVEPPTASSLSAPRRLPFRPTSSHTSLGSGHTFPSLLALESGSVHLSPASPSLGPEPARSTLAPPQWSTLDQGEVGKTAHTGTHLTQEQCQVASGRIPCMVRRSSKEDCQQAGCCYDNSRAVPCYYGNTATVQCFRDGHSAVVVSRETASAHRITLGNVRLAYAPSSCSPSQETEAFVVFRFPLTSCGTTVQVLGSQLVYENQLVSDVDIRSGPEGSITRDGAFRLQVRCIFNASDFLPIQAAIFPPPSPGPVTQSGPLRLELRIAKDENFSSYYGKGDYPLVRLLREPLHVEVRLLQRVDPQLGLVLHQCWATPSTSPFQQPQWPLLADGCPFNGDSYRTRMVASEGTALPFPSPYQRFTASTFTFLDPGSQQALRGLVYFFCSASACRPSGPDTCSTTCSTGTARLRRFSGHPHNAAGPQNLVSSPGPVGFEDSYGQEPTLGPTGPTGNSKPKPPLWAVVLLLAVALVLVVSVFLGLSQTWARKLQEGNRG